MTSGVVRASVYSGDLVGDRTGLLLILTSSGGACRTSVVNGKPHGKEIVYNALGVMTARRNYIDGRLEGLAEGWYTNGFKRVQELYVHGERDGVSVTFFPDGQMRARGRYDHGQKVGSWQEWYADGEERRTLSCADGELQQVIWPKQVQEDKAGVLALWRSMPPTHPLAQKRERVMSLFHEGMSKEEIVSLLGPPSLQEDAHWSWVISGRRQGRRSLLIIRWDPYGLVAAVGETTEIP